MSLISTKMQGSLLVALSGVLYGVLGYLGTKLLYANFDISTMLFWRFFIASLWMFFYIIFFVKPKKIELSWRFLSFTLLISALSYSSSSAFYFLASSHIGTGLSMVIFFSFPIFVALFAWFFTDWKVNRFTFFSLMLVLFGLFFLKGKDSGAIDNVGLIFAIIAAVSYAIYVYGAQFNPKNIHPSWMTLLVCVSNTLIFLVFSLGKHQFIIPDTLKSWLYILAIGIISTALPIQLLLLGLKYINSVKASIISVLEPVVTLLVGISLLNESLTGLQMFGVIIVLIGALLIQFESSPN